MLGLRRWPLRVRFHLHTNLAHSPLAATPSSATRTIADALAVQTALQLHTGCIYLFSQHIRTHTRAPLSRTPFNKTPPTKQDAAALCTTPTQHHIV